jgi:hypothetical protein
MPQITVNEIDQSVVTRVVSDDKVKVFCPIIASFGPGYDGTQSSVKTFTDVTDFNRAFGYTYAEFNPFTNDHSRMYARELIKKGAAVSVVRINNAGETPVFNINGISPNRTTDITDQEHNYEKFGQICFPVFNCQELISCTKTKTISGSNVSESDFNKKCVIPGSVTVVLKYSATDTLYTVTDYKKDGKFYVKSLDLTSEIVATISYIDGTFVINPDNHNPSGGIAFELISATYNYIGDPDSDNDDAFLQTFDFNKFIFAPQIASITAKYPGSFGNNIAISITQVNTSRLAESYQYASISVYYIDRKINYKYDATTGETSVSSQIVNSVTLLENKLISTNPDATNYFEDVEFDFIKINASRNARDELSIIWSNINASPISTSQYSGFPPIPLKYKPLNSYIMQYNFDAFMNGGTDFPYSPDILAKLKSGFKGYLTGTDTWTVQDVNKYLNEVYGNETTIQGIIPSIFDSLSSLYDEFTDPYIYDFDFITSSGFIYEKYKLTYTPKTDTIEKDTNDKYITTNNIIPGTVCIDATIETEDPDNPEQTIQVNIKLQDDRNSTSESVRNIINTDGGAVVGSINYSQKTITLSGVSPVNNTIIVTYGSDDIPQRAEVIIPTQVSSDDDVHTSVYTAVTPIHQSMLNLVNTRQDCIALFDLPRDYEKYSAVEYSKMLNTSYGTIHHPWCWINSPDVAGKQIIMVPSYIFLYTFLSNLIDNVDSQKWFPPAGVDRATAKVVVRPDYEIGSVILADWQNDNISRVNPIMRLKQYGYVIYGQYTTLPAIDLYTHSALESLNVRLISNVVKKKIFDACLNLAFNPNNEKLWLSFFAQLDPFLRYMKYNDGLYDYRIVMDKSTVTTDDINHLRCPGKVFIAPTRTAEFFDIDFIITEAGAVFSD